jgi:Zn-finger nucleic acid-binding protein
MDEMSSQPVRRCPECLGTMSPHTVRSLRLDICDACGGVWFDAGEFGRISNLGSRSVDDVVAQEPPNIRAATHPQVIDCPVCGTPLDRYNFCGSSGVMLGGCSTCHGIYLSHDDLIRLDDRDQRLEKRGGGLNADEAAAVGWMDGEIAYDQFRSRLAVYNWAQLENPVMFS